MKPYLRDYVSASRQVRKAEQPDAAWIICHLAGFEVEKHKWEKFNLWLGGYL